MRPLNIRGMFSASQSNLGIVRGFCTSQLNLRIVGEEFSLNKSVLRMLRDRFRSTQSKVSQSSGRMVELWQIRHQNTEGGVQL